MAAFTANFSGGVAVIVGLEAYQTTAYRPVSDKLPTFSVAFGDPAWDGKVVPPGQYCKKFGGNGATPPLKVSQIPIGANAVIVEFNAES